MRVTRKRLVRIIKEELNSLNEKTGLVPDSTPDPRIPEGWTEAGTDGWATYYTDFTGRSEDTDGDGAQDETEILDDIVFIHPDTDELVTVKWGDTHHEDIRRAVFGDDPTGKGSASNPWGSGE